MKWPRPETLRACAARIWKGALGMGGLPGRLAHAWGRVYLVDLNSPRLVVRVYDGKGMVYNFTGTHAVPRVSERLRYLHARFHENPTYPLARAFAAEVEELGGISLYWV